MNKHELAERLAKQSHRSRGQAADAVDKFVYGLLKELQRAPSKAQEIAQSDSPKPPSSASSRAR